MSVIDRPPRILVVDDDELIRRMLAKSFSDDGFEVAVAADGRAATDLFSEFSPDVVLMDIIMPDREGVETTIDLRKLDAAVPIIAMSGGGRIGPSEFLTLAVALGATTSIKKPFTVKQILTLVRQVMPQPTALAT